MRHRTPALTRLYLALACVALAWWGGTAVPAALGIQRGQGEPADPADVADPALSLGSQIATYRLTMPVFAQFEEASRSIATLTRDDPRFVTAPLFTRQVALLGDIQAVALGLEARLGNDQALATALASAKLTPRDYAKFALVLIAARMAHGFVSAGVLRGVPLGVTADNVAFVAAHQTEVGMVLDVLGVDGMPTDAR